MKKLVLIGVLCLSLTVGAFALDFSVKASGGVSLLFGGDYNAAVQGQNDSASVVPLIVINSKLSKLSLASDFGAEFTLHFTDTMGLGLGLGYTRASNDSTLAAHYGLIGVSMNFKPSVSVVPLTLSFHYFLPLSSLIKLHFFAGPGLYFTSLKFESIMIQTLGPFEVVKGILNFTPDSKIAPGFQGGMGIEFGVSRNIALLLDVAGRYLSVSNFGGPATLEGHNGIFPIHISANATLYYYEDVLAGNNYGDLTVDVAMPSGFGIASARAASISLSGIQFQTGVRIYF